MEFWQQPGEVSTPPEQQQQRSNSARHRQETGSAMCCGMFSSPGGLILWRKAVEPNRNRRTRTKKKKTESFREFHGVCSPRLEPASLLLRRSLGLCLVEMFRRSGASRAGCPGMRRAQGPLAQCLSEAAARWSCASPASVSVGSPFCNPLVRTLRGAGRYQDFSASISSCQRQ